MTQLRKQKDAISNYFDEIEYGILKRGSSFTDIDGVSHDGHTKRFLFREFKQPRERLDSAVRWMYTDLAALPGCTVWFLRRLENALIGFGQFRSGRREEQIRVAEYQRRLCCWRNAEDWSVHIPAGSAWPRSRRGEADLVVGELTAADIHW